MVQSASPSLGKIIFFCFNFSYNSYFNQVVPGYGFLQDLWRNTAALFCEEQARQKKLMKTYSGPVKIASLPLNQYKPEEISLDVDGEFITIHGQHRYEGEDGFENSEFKKIIKLPEDVDPTSVTSQVTRDGSLLVLNGIIKRVEKEIKPNDGKFVAKLDLRGFKPEEINIQIRGHELIVAARHRSEDGSRDYRRRVLLPDDVDLSSLTSRLSYKGVLIIEVSRDPAFVKRERNVDFAMKGDKPRPQDGAKQEASSNTA